MRAPRSTPPMWRGAVPSGRTWPRAPRRSGRAAAWSGRSATSTPGRSTHSSVRRSPSTPPRSGSASSRTNRGCSCVFTHETGRGSILNRTATRGGSWAMTAFTRSSAASGTGSPGGPSTPVSTSRSSTVSGGSATPNSIGAPTSWPPPCATVACARATGGHPAAQQRLLRRIAFRRSETRGHLRAHQLRFAAPEVEYLLADSGADVFVWSEALSRSSPGMRCFGEDVRVRLRVTVGATRATTKGLRNPARSG